MKSLLDTPLSLDLLEQGTVFNGEVLPNVADGHALHLVGFALQSHVYTEAKLKVQGVKDYQLFVDGKKHSG